MVHTVQVDLSHLQELIRHYGYLAVFVGTVLEGETLLVMAGFAAQLGSLDLYSVMAIAAAGGFAGDQLWFAAGRWRGRPMRARFPGVQAQAARMERLIDRHSTWLSLGVRFMYGMRMVGAVLLGMSQASYLRFIALNLLGALMWAVLVGGAGYLFGQAVELVLQDAKRYAIWLLPGIVAAGLAFWLWWYLRKRATLAGDGE